MTNEHLQRYSRHVYFNHEDQDYVALSTEFPHLSAVGETPEEALNELDVVLEAAIEIHTEEGWPLPQPEAPPAPQGLPSGRFVVRVPRTLHHRLTRQAKEDGVSLNQLANTYLAAGLALAQHPTVAPDLQHCQERVQAFTSRARTSTTNLVAWSPSDRSRDPERKPRVSSPTVDHTDETTLAVVAPR